MLAKPPETRTVGPDVLNLITDADIKATVADHTGASSVSSETAPAETAPAVAAGAEAAPTEQPAGDQSAAEAKPGEAAPAQPAAAAPAAAPTAPAAAPTAPAAQAEPKVSELVGWQQRLAQQEAQLQAKLAEIEQRQQSLEPALKLQQRLEAVKSDPRLGLELLGVDYATLSKAFASSPPPPAEVLEVRAENKKLGDQFAALREEIALQNEAGRASAALADPKYELTRRVGNITPEWLAQQVRALRAKGQPADYPALLDEHERYLKGRLDGFGAPPKDAKGQPAAAAPAAAGDAKPPPPAPTLSSRAAGEPAPRVAVPRSEKERRNMALSLLGEDFAKGWT